MVFHPFSGVLNVPTLPGAGGANIPSVWRGGVSFGVELSGCAGLLEKCKNYHKPSSPGHGCVYLGRSQMGWCFCVVKRIRVRIIENPFRGTS